MAVWTWRWKEKYLKSVELQDKLERRWNARLDLLRRGLVRSTLAAEVPIVRSTSA